MSRLVGGEAGGGEAGAKTDGDPFFAGMRIQARIFIVVATVVLVQLVVYLFLARESAGATMLLLTGAMGLLIGGYLRIQSRKKVEPAASGPHRDYLPEASIWPLGIGLGAALMLNGLVLGLWAILPGAFLVGAATLGYGRQSRRRD